jgi:uncharacterized protein YndB with AHSA1/START domain
LSLSDPASGGGLYRLSARQGWICVTTRGEEARVDAVTIERSVELDAAASHVWAAIRTPVAFRYVTRGVLRITGWPRTGRFGQGTRVEGWLLLGGVLPLHRHHLEVVRVDHVAMTLSSHEWGGVLRRWDHDIIIERLDPGRCRYTDRVLIDAGPFTMPVAVFAWLFYRYRQSRWRQLVRHAPRG